jgi:hypothetical protein
MPPGFTVTRAEAVGSGFQLDYSFGAMEVNSAAQAVTFALQANGWTITEIGTAMDGIVYDVSGFSFEGSLSVSTAMGPEVQVTLNPTG